MSSGHFGLSLFVTLWACDYGQSTSFPLPQFPNYRDTSIYSTHSPGFYETQKEDTSISVTNYTLTILMSSLTVTLQQ